MSEELLQKGAMRGICHIYFETGYEGSCWAFQDERYISKVLPSYGVWRNETVWDSEDPKCKGKTKNDAEVFRNGKWYPLPDPILNDPDYIKSSLYCGESRGDREADKRLMDKYGFIIKYTANQFGTPSTEPDRPYGVCRGELTRVTVEWEDGLIQSRLSNSFLVISFSYAGLHILKSGDELIVYDKNDPSLIVWKGIIQLGAGEYPGCPIQNGVDLEAWKSWFREEYPAMLIKLR